MNNSDWYVIGELITGLFMGLFERIFRPKKKVKEIETPTEEQVNI